MKIVVEEFQKIIKKATLNLLIDSVRLNITKDRVISCMRHNSGSISVLNLPNNLVLDVAENDELEFNFSSPATNVMPYLNLIDEDEVDLNITASGLFLKNGRQQIKLQFCSDSIPSVFGSSDIKNVDYFKTLPVSDDFLRYFNKIQKIGNMFGTVYFTVEDKKFYIETTDKKIQYCNGLKFELDNIDKNDLHLAFDYLVITNLFKILDIPEKSYVMKWLYLEDKDQGLMSCLSEDESEKYFLMSKLS